MIMHKMGKKVLFKKANEPFNGKYIYFYFIRSESVFSAFGRVMIFFKTIKWFLAHFSYSWLRNHVQKFYSIDILQVSSLMCWLFSFPLYKLCVVRCDRSTLICLSYFKYTYGIPNHCDRPFLSLLNHPHMINEENNQNDCCWNSIILFTPTAAAYPCTDLLYWIGQCAMSSEPCFPLLLLLILPFILKIVI